MRHFTLVVELVEVSWNLRNLAVKVDWMGDVAGLLLEVRSSSSYCFKVTLISLPEFLIFRLVDIKLGFLSLFGLSLLPLLLNLVLPELAMQDEGVGAVALPGYV